MVFGIFMCLVIYLLGAYLPSIFMIGRVGLWRYLGTRDGEPTPNLVHGRTKRASANFQENLPVFLALALLSMIIIDADQAYAMTGAKIFVLSRVAYIPAYMSGVPLLSSSIYTVSLAGLGLMAWALM